MSWLMSYNMKSKRGLTVIKNCSVGVVMSYDEVKLCYDDLKDYFKNAPAYGGVVNAAPTGIPSYDSAVSLPVHKAIAIRLQEL